MESRRQKGSLLLLREQHRRREMRPCWGSDQSTFLQVKPKEHYCEGRGGDTAPGQQRNLWACAGAGCHRLWQPWENPSGCSRGLGNTTTPAHLLLSCSALPKECASSSQERVPGAASRPDEGKQNLGRTLAPAENALPEH